MPDSNTPQQDTTPSLPGFALVMTEQIKALTGKVMEVQEAQDEIQRTLRGHNGHRGIVSRVDSIELIVGQIAADVKAMRQKEAPAPLPAAHDDDEDYVSWRYIVDKLGVPIALTAIGFGISVLCPATIVLAMLLPNILKLLGVQ